MKDEIKIENINEFNKQIKENILNSGHYARLDLIIGEENEIPYNNIEFHNCSTNQIMALYMLLQEDIKLLEEKYPMECKMSSLIIGIETFETFEQKGSEDESGKNE